MKKSMNAHRTITRIYATGLAALGLAGAAVSLAPAPADAQPYRHKPVSVERARTVEASKHHGRKRCWHPFRAVRVKCSGGRYELHPYGRD